MHSSWSLLVLPCTLALAAGACSDPARPGNQPPKPVDLSETTNEDTPLEIRVLDAASDPDHDPLTVVAATTASVHTVEVIDRTVIKLTPQRDFHGTIDITYNVSDGVLRGTAHISVTVRPVNDPPVASAAQINLLRGGVIALEAHDVDGDSLRYEITQSPAHGTLTGDGPQFTYETAAGFAGSDSFVYRVHDGQLASEPATVSLTIRTGEAPVAMNSAQAVTEDVPMPLTLMASDADQDPLTYIIVTRPEHGTLNEPVTGPNPVYTPDRDFAGTDRIEFKVSDGFAESAVAQVEITVAPVNDPPVATGQGVFATEDTTASITLSGSDVDTDGDALRFMIDSQPHNGTLSQGTGASRTYTPTTNFHGTDSFRFHVFDGSRSSATVEVTIDVESVDDLPTAVAKTINGLEDTTAQVALAGNDADGDPITSFDFTQPSAGELTGTPPALTYTPPANFNGTATFSYTVTAGGVTSAPATITLQVAAVNDPPVAVDGNATTNEDTQVTIPLTASDIDADRLTFSIVTQPGDGTLQLNGASAVYRPASNVSGQRTFQFRVFDGTVNSNTATVTIDIAAVNDPPRATDDFVGIDADTPLTFPVLGNDSDVEGETLTLDDHSEPEHGEVEIVDNKLRYTPDPGFTGRDDITYTVVDTQGGEATGQVRIGVGQFPPGAPAETIATVSGGFFFATQRAPAISRNERYIAFSTQLPLIADDTNSSDDIYLFDRSTRELTRVSMRNNGGQANGDSLRPQLSDDGRYVAFDSDSTNLVAGDTNQKRDVFRRDRKTGETIRLSVASSGSQGSGDSFDARMSGDGNLVAFVSTAFELTDDDRNGVSDIVIRDITAGTTARISQNLVGSDGDRESLDPAISRDGRYVAFSSEATNLVVNDGNGASDVFLRDRVTGTTTRMSVTSTGQQANGRSDRPSISEDGRSVSFLSSAPIFGPGTALYVHDTQSLATTGVPSSATWGRLSGDGRYVTGFFQTFNSTVSSFIRDRFTGSVSGQPSTWYWPVLSGPGRYVVTLDNVNGGRVIVVPNPL